MDDMMFETELRAMLHRRDPGPARAGYPGMVLARVRLEPLPSRFDWARRGLSGFAAVAAVLALAVVAAIVLRPEGPGPVASSGPLPSPAPGLVAGDGITSREFFPFLQIVGWLVVFGGTIRLVAHSQRRVATVAGTLAVVGLIWVAANIGTSDAIVETGMVGAIDPDLATGLTDHDITVSVTGDQPFRTILVLQNGSRAPLTILGMVPTSFYEGYDPPIVPRFVGLGRLPDESYVFGDVRPFEPVTVQPGGLVNVVALAMSGACAVGRDAEAGGGYGLESITLVYDQLSIVHTQDVRLTRTIRVTARTPCPAESPSPGAP